MSGYDFSHSKTVKIRKPRLCNECNEKHFAGEEMERFTGVFFGEFYSKYMCSCCAASTRTKEYLQGWEHFDIAKASKPAREELSRLREWCGVTK